MRITAIFLNVNLQDCSLNICRYSYLPATKRNKISMRLYRRNGPTSKQSFRDRPLNRLADASNSGHNLVDIENSLMTGRYGMQKTGPHPTASSVGTSSLMPLSHISLMPLLYLVFNTGSLPDLAEMAQTRTRQCLIVKKLITEPLFSWISTPYVLQPYWPLPEMSAMSDHFNDTDSSWAGIPTAPL